MLKTADRQGKKVYFFNPMGWGGLGRLPVVVAAKRAFFPAM